MKYSYKVSIQTRHVIFAHHLYSSNNRTTWVSFDEMENELLIHVYTKSLVSSQDPKSGLYPFMMFAVVEDGAPEVYSLSEIYNALHASHWQIWLK